MAAVSTPPSQPGFSDLRKVWGISEGRSFLSCAEVAKIFVVSPLHMKRLCDNGELVGEPIPGRKASSVNYWRIPIPALLDFIKRRSIRVKAEPPPAAKKPRCKRPAPKLQPA